MGPRTEWLALRIKEARAEGSLPYALISLRCMPFTPHWLLNLALPWVRQLPRRHPWVFHTSLTHSLTTLPVAQLGVSLPHFAAYTFFGMMPSVLVTVRAGTILSEVGAAAALPHFPPRACPLTPRPLRCAPVCPSLWVVCQIRGLEDVFDAATVVQLVVLGALASVPAYLKHRAHAPAGKRREE